MLPKNVLLPGGLQPSGSGGKELALEDEDRGFRSRRVIWQH